MKTLYFEGAGCEWTQTGEIPNCRIRTAFNNDKGEKVYLEILGTVKTVADAKKYKRYQGYEVGEAIGFIDACFYITEDKEIDDCNESRLQYEVNGNISYSYDGILKFVNEQCGCSFDEVVILNGLSGYRVFSDKGRNTIESYNYGDEFEYDAELEKKRNEIKAHYHDLEKSEGKKYPNFSLWVDADDKHLLHLLRHFNGYNKHWSIRTDTDNWKDTVEETTLGKCAC